MIIYFLSIRKTSDDLHPRKTAYQTSFYLGGSSRSDCWRDEYRNSKK